jgi:carboxyl-terminal processing protease
MLPAFYNDFSKEDGRSSSEDVRKELEDLKKKNVEGIILDLRLNTGGALSDAIKMTGLFFPDGPVVQVKNKQSKVRVLNDEDSGVTYDGPLVVLVNTISASASEILAAALQDYNRAVIVGGSHSYGKGTVQAMVNLDNLFNQRLPGQLSFGALTITIQKFYRIDGTSIQLKGVKPDIILPDRYDYLEIGEKHLENSLNWDIVPSASFEKWQPQSPATANLIRRSRERVNNNPNFQLIKEYGERVKSLREHTLQNLDLASAIQRKKELEAESKKLEKANVELKSVDVLPSKELENKGNAELEKIALENQNRWFKELKQDIILGESVEILTDMNRRQ